MGYLTWDLNYTCLDYIGIISLGKAVANVSAELEKAFSTSANALHGLQYEAEGIDCASLDGCVVWDGLLECAI